MMNPLHAGEFMKHPLPSAMRGVDDGMQNCLNYQKKTGSGGGSSVDSVVRQTVLRSTLPGEYASLLLLCHSLLGTVFWTVHTWQNPAALIMVAAGVWIAFRAVGGFAGEKWAAGISAAMLLMTVVLSITGLSNVPAWLSGSLVAPIVWAGMLGLLVIVDLLDCRLRQYADLNLTEKRKQDGRLLKFLFAGLFLAWGLGVPMASLIHQISHPPTGEIRLEEMSFVEHAGFRCGEALVTACFFALGCNIGSFLNVVAWRMPMGRSIVSGDSCCPGCNTPIARRDNIPIFGWLSLGGRCRTCSTEISSRYPIVEAITGTIFLLLYFVELISGGANLPVRPVNHYRGVLWIIMYAKWDLIGLYMYHCFLFASLLVFTLMAIDNNRVPRKLLVFCFLTGIAAPVMFPSLVLISALPGTTTPANAVVEGLLHGVVGATCGMIAGALLSRWLIYTQQSSAENNSITASMSLIGMVVGWQAMISVAAIFLVLRWLQKQGFQLACGSKCRSMNGDLLLAALWHHVFWRLEWAVVNIF